MKVERGGMSVSALSRRIADYDWPAIDTELDGFGAAKLPGLLAPADCDTLRALYDDDHCFRSRINMARYGFGRGEYKYFRYPLPDPVARLRQLIYPHTARTANRWAGWLKGDDHYPPSLDKMLKRCHDAGQTRPTPLLLRYRAGDYNCLHQDLYGAHVFPLQLVILLSDPGEFEGGEFVLTEQRPRMQSRADVISLNKGCGALFAVNERPRKGTKAYHRVKLRHGVSRVHTGERYTLGIIFHDAA